MELDSKVTFENYQSINEFHEPIHLDGPHFAALSVSDRFLKPMLTVPGKLAGVGNRLRNRSPSQALANASEGARLRERER